MEDRSKPVKGRWMNVEEMAEYIDSTPSGVRTAVHRGRLPYTKRGTRLLFDRDAVDAWLTASAVPVGR